MVHHRSVLDLQDGIRFFVLRVESSRIFVKMEGNRTSIEFCKFQMEFWNSTEESYELHPLVSLN